MALAFLRLRQVLYDRELWRRLCSLEGPPAAHTDDLPASVFPTSPGVYAGSGTSGSDTDADRRAGSGTSCSDTDAGRRADRFHGSFAMGSEDADDGSPMVDVALEEPSSETAAAELAGMLMRLPEPATPANPPPEHLRSGRVWDTELRGQAAIFRDDVQEAFASFSGEMTLSQFLNEAASVCQNSDGSYNAYAVAGVSVFLRKTGVKRHFGTSLERVIQDGLERTYLRVSRGRFAKQVAKQRRRWFRHGRLERR